MSFLKKLGFSLFLLLATYSEVFDFVIYFFTRGIDTQYSLWKDLFHLCRFVIIFLSLTVSLKVCYQNNSDKQTRNQTTFLLEHMPFWLRLIFIVGVLFAAAYEFYHFYETLLSSSDYLSKGIDTAISIIVLVCLFFLSKLIFPKKRDFS